MDDLTKRFLEVKDETRAGDTAAALIVLAEVIQGKRPPEETPLSKMVAKFGTEADKAAHEKMTTGRDGGRSVTPD